MDIPPGFTTPKPFLQEPEPEPYNDTDLEKLLLLDDEEGKELERYDKGDPEFMTKALTDMRTLDFLLQERLSREASLRQKRKRHLNNVRQTLSEIAIPNPSRQEGRHESENTKRFLSATELEYFKVDPGEEMSTIDEVSESNVRSSESSLSMPKRVTEEELEEFEKEWALMPVEEAEERQVSPSSATHEVSQENFDPLEGKPEASAQKSSFLFSFAPPKIDHVKRNILRGGHYYTPDEQARLDELLTAPESGQTVMTMVNPNPFELLDSDIRVLENIEECLRSVRVSQELVPEQKVGTGDAENPEKAPENLKFGFYKTSREENLEASQRFAEISSRLQEIESQEKIMLGKMLEGSEAEPLATREGITAALEKAKRELLMTFEKSGEPNKGAVMPCISEEDLQLVLGPVPRISHYDDLCGKQLNLSAVERWRGWLEERKRSLMVLDDVSSEEDSFVGKSRVKEQELHEELLSVEEMQKKFRILIADVKRVREKVDVLIEQNAAVMEDCGALYLASEYPQSITEKLQRTLTA